MGMRQNGFWSLKTTRSLRPSNNISIENLNARQVDCFLHLLSHNLSDFFLQCEKKLKI